MFAGGIKKRVMISLKGDFVLLKKRRGGNVIDFIPILMTLFVVTIMIVILTSWVVNIENKNNIDLIARKYLLQMETEGYLTEEGKQSMLNELVENKMTNISLFGTSMSQVGYGNTIELHLKGSLEIYNFRWVDLFSVYKDSGNIEINKYLTSTAKY